MQVNIDYADESYVKYLQRNMEKHQRVWLSEFAGFGCELIGGLTLPYCTKVFPRVRREWSFDLADGTCAVNDMFSVQI